MDINNDKELKYIIDELIQYHSDINEHIKELHKNKRLIQNIIKRYILESNTLNKEDKTTFDYQTNDFSVKLSVKQSKKVKMNNLTYKSYKIKISNVIKEVEDN